VSDSRNRHATDILESLDWFGWYLNGYIVPLKMI